MLGGVLRRHDDRAAAGRDAALRLVVDREYRGAERETRADAVGHEAHPRGRVEEQACLPGNELRTRRLEVEQGHLAFGHEPAEVVHYLAANRVVECDPARVVEHAAAFLIDDGLEEPRIRPDMRVVAHPRDTGRSRGDLRGECDHAVERIRHLRGIAAGLLHEIGVEVKDGQRRVHGQPVLPAVHLAELDDRIGVVLAAPRGRLGRELRTEVDDLPALFQR